MFLNHRHNLIQPFFAHTLDTADFLPQLTKIKRQSICILHDVIVVIGQKVLHLLTSHAFNFLVPTSYEAAQIDGAGKMAQMKYVVLPSILSTIVIMLINRIGSLLNVGYEKVLLLYNPNTYVTADVVSTFAQRYGIADGLVGVASAAEMLNNVMGMILVIAANTIARKASDVSLY